MSKQNTSPAHPASKMQICPHLGIEEDPQTCLGYSSPWNFCHRSKPVQAVRLSYQRAKCLCARHLSCAVFLEHELRPLPRELCVTKKSPAR